MCYFSIKIIKIKIPFSSEDKVIIKHYQLDKGYHCVKSVFIRSYSGPDFPALRLNTERYSKCVKIRTRITPNTYTFYAVYGEIKLLTEFPNRCCTLSGLRNLIKKIDQTGSTDHLS